MENMIETWLKTGSWELIHLQDAANARDWMRLAETSYRWTAKILGWWP